MIKLVKREIFILTTKLKQFFFKHNNLWPVVIIVKILLHSLPIKYQVINTLLFKHGNMDTYTSASKVFLYHCQKTEMGMRSAFTFLELGPGDSVASGLFAYAYGASEIYLVDNGDYISKSNSIYQELIKNINKRGDIKRMLPELAANIDILDYCKKLNIAYFTKGLNSLKKVPSESIDIIFSNAVLEHIFLEEFSTICKELYRISKNDSIASHTTDLKDHLGGNLNSLRVPKSIWESRLFKDNGFYTNRLRYSEIISDFECVGYTVLPSDIHKWKEMPIQPRSLIKSFRSFKSEEMLIKDFNLVLTKAHRV